ncbi:MAG: hypothetical protein MI810_04265 [Flavobacteriales bacterium]|nr:hypothetical protein [Flavobacteriales bacterium]
MNKIGLFTLFTFFSSFGLSQKQLHISTDLDRSFDRYSVTISTPSGKEYLQQSFTTPDTLLIYEFPLGDTSSTIKILFTAYIEKNSCFHISEIIRLDSTSITHYTFGPLSKDQIRYFSKCAPSTSFFPKDYGFFKKDRLWGLSTAYSFQQQPILQIGLTRTSLPTIKSRKKTDGQPLLRYFSFSYITAGVDLIFLKPSLSIAPKLSTGFNFSFLDFNCNLVGYNDFSDFDLAVVPEVGLSLFGWFKINYGYNFFFNSKSQFNLNKHRLSLTLNYFFVGS